MFTYHEGAVRRGSRDTARRRRYCIGGGREEANSSQVKARDEVRLQLRVRGDKCSLLLPRNPLREHTSDER